MSRSEVKRLYEQTYTWKRKFLRRDKSITELSYIKYMDGRILYFIVVTLK